MSLVGHFYQNDCSWCWAYCSCHRKWRALWMGLGPIWKLGPRWQKWSLSSWKCFSYSCMSTYCYYLFLTQIYRKQHLRLSSSWERFPWFIYDDYVADMIINIPQFTLPKLRIISSPFPFQLPLWLPIFERCSCGCFWGMLNLCNVVVSQAAKIKYQW